MDLKKILGPKKAIDPLEKEAKLNAIKDMRKMAGDVMNDGLKNKMSQVTVAAKDPDKLAEGLETAKEMLQPEEASEEHSPEELEKESPDEDYAEMLAACDSPEKIDELMKKLAEKKAKLAAE